MAKFSGQNSHAARLDLKLIGPQQPLELMKLQPDLLSDRLRKLVERDVLSDFDLSLMSLNILYVIMTLGQTTQSEIGMYLLTTKSNLSQRTDRLIRAGLVNVTERDSDKRTKQLTLTARGEKLTEKVVGQLQNYERKLEKRFTSDEILRHMQFQSRLEKVLSEMENS